MGSCWILNLGASRAARRLTPLTTANRPTKSRLRTQGPLRRQWPYLLDGWWIPWPWRAIYFRGRDPWFARFATLGPGAPVSTRLCTTLTSGRWIPRPWRALYLRGWDPSIAVIGPGVPVSTRSFLRHTKDREKIESLRSEEKVVEIYEFNKNLCISDC